ncbi:MAG: ATP synthase F1 subunit gamma [Phycisphaerales bacterium]|nr:ATP synthase F1 subunit gamma [Phycisphaerales bacterium]
MAKTREIKKRIKAVGNIRRITKTMQMIATSKFAKAQQRALATKPYTEGVFALVTELAGTAGNIDHPLIAGPAKFRQGAGELTLVLTSDRGLCGPYNGAVLRTAMAHLRGHGSASPSHGGIIELVGKKGAGFLRFNHTPVAATHSLGDKPAFEQVERIAQTYIDRFAAGEVTAVRVIYMRYLSAGKQVPEVLQLLPLKPPAARNKPAGGIVAEYEFSPPAKELLGDLLPATVKATLFQAVSDAIVSEQVARMVAMKSATDNAGKMRKSLTRDFNRARQAQITTELTEIVSGAAALA